MKYKVAPLCFLIVLILLIWTLYSEATMTDLSKKSSELKKANKELSKTSRNPDKECMELFKVELMKLGKSEKEAEEIIKNTKEER